MKIQLEPATFRIPVTEDWKPCENKKWRESPTNDVWVHDCGEQLFTWDSAIRETTKVGKRLPTDEELEEMQPEDFTDLLAGHRGTDGSFDFRGAHAYIWTSTCLGENAWERNLYSGDTTVFRGTFTKSYGFSARCVLREGTKGDIALDNLMQAIKRINLACTELQKVFKK